MPLQLWFISIVYSETHFSLG